MNTDEKRRKIQAAPEEAAPAAQPQVGVGAFKGWLGRLIRSDHPSLEGMLENAFSAGYLQRCGEQRPSTPVSSGEPAMKRSYHAVADYTASPLICRRDKVPAASDGFTGPRGLREHADGSSTADKSVEYAGPQEQVSVQQRKHVVRGEERRKLDSRCVATHVGGGNFYWDETSDNSRAKLHLKERRIITDRRKAPSGEKKMADPIYQCDSCGKDLADEGIPANICADCHRPKAAKPAPDKPAILAPPVLESAGKFLRENNYGDSAVCGKIFDKDGDAHWLTEILEAYSVLPAQRLGHSCSGFPRQHMEELGIAVSSTMHEGIIETNYSNVRAEVAESLLRELRPMAMHSPYCIARRRKSMACNCNYDALITKLDKILK